VKVLTPTSKSKRNLDLPEEVKGDESIIIKEKNVYNFGRGEIHERMTKKKGD
jgi:hypothetical protein